MTPKLALGIGLCQCMALWPGFSRSGSTIMGGMLLGEKRALAAEYSFVAAVPIMFAATGYALLKTWSLFTVDDIPLFAPGLFFAFLFGWLAIKTFIALVGRITLRPFAVYRLLLAPIVYFFMVNMGSRESWKGGRDPSEEGGSIPTVPPSPAPPLPRLSIGGGTGVFPAGGGCFAGVRPFFGKSYQRITRRALYCSARFFVGSGISTELSNPNRIPFTCAFRKNPFPHCPVRTAVLGACSEPPGEGRQAGCPVSHPSHR